MTSGVVPLKLLDHISQRYVQNAKLYAINHDLGFYPVNTKSSIFRCKPSCLKMEKQSASLGGGHCLNQTATVLRAAFSLPYTHAFCIFRHRSSFTENTQNMGTSENASPFMKRRKMYWYTVTDFT